MEFEDIQAELSITETLSSSLISRRAFLMAAASGIGVACMPGWLRDNAYGADPLMPNQKILLMIQLGGGNDGLNTVVPVGTGAYYDHRKTLAIAQASTLPLAAGLGLHPSLPKLKARFDANQVAIVQGVGHAKPDLSHFQSIATWQQGWTQGRAESGWLGRYLDGVGKGPLSGVAIGTSIPLHMRGAKTLPTSLPREGTALFGANRATDKRVDRVSNALTDMGAQRYGLGPLGDRIVQNGRDGVAVAGEVASCYAPVRPPGEFVRQMALCAHLINANVGIRVLNVTGFGFDTHADQAGTHSQLLTELDTAIETFYKTLNPTLSKQVALMTFSEFGRRVASNGTGTDHGSAAPLFVIGEGVKGGLYGEHPSLANLDQNGNMKASVDFRSVYGTVLDDWMDADSTQLLGSDVENLGFFRVAAPPPTTTTQPPGSTTSTTGPAATTTTTGQPGTTSTTAPGTTTTTTGQPGTTSTTAPGTTTTTVRPGTTSTTAPASVLPVVITPPTPGPEQIVVPRLANTGANAIGQAAVGFLLMGMGGLASVFGRSSTKSADLAEDPSEPEA